MNKKSHVLIGTMFLLILFVFLGCPMDSNLSKDKDQNGQPALVTIVDGEVDFGAITENLSKNQAVKLGTSSEAGANITIPGTFTIPAGKELIIGDKITLDLMGATATITGTLTAEGGATLKMKAGSDYYSGNGKTVFKKGSTALWGSDKFLGDNASGSVYQWDNTVSGQLELGKNKINVVSGTLTVANNSDIQAGYEVSVAKDATLKVAAGKTLNLLATSTFNAVGAVDVFGIIKVAGTIAFQESIKNHITLINNGKVIAAPKSTVSLKIGNDPSVVVIGTGGFFTWEKNSGGGVELGSENGFTLTHSTNLELVKEYVVTSADTIKVADHAILAIKSNGALKGTDANTTLIVDPAGGITLAGGTANFYDSLSVKIDEKSISEGTYKWDPAINEQAGGWKKQ